VKSERRKGEWAHRRNGEGAKRPVGDQHAKCISREAAVQNSLGIVRQYAEHRRLRFNRRLDRAISLGMAARMLTKTHAVSPLRRCAHSPFRRYAISPFMVHLQQAHIRPWFPSSLLWLVLRFGQRYAISLGEQDAIIQQSHSPYGNILGSRKELDCGSKRSLISSVISQMPCRPHCVPTISARFIG
jgi:hypothetical protein